MSHRVTQIWEEIRVQRIERSEKSPTYVNLIYDKINTLNSGQRINCLIKYSEIISILLREKIVKIYFILHTKINYRWILNSKNGKTKVYL